MRDATCNNPPAFRPKNENDCRNHAADRNAGIHRSSSSEEKEIQHPAGTDSEHLCLRAESARILHTEVRSNCWDRNRVSTCWKQCGLNASEKWRINSFWSGFGASVSEKHTATNATINRKA